MSKRKKNAINDDGTGEFPSSGGGIRLFGATSRHDYEFLIMDGIKKGFTTTPELHKFIEAGFKTGRKKSPCFSSGMNCPFSILLAKDLLSNDAKILLRLGLQSLSACHAHE